VLEGHRSVLGDEHTTTLTADSTYQCDLQHSLTKRGGRARSTRGSSTSRVRQSPLFPCCPSPQSCSLLRRHRPEQFHVAERSATLRRSLVSFGLDARYPRQNHEHDGKPCPFAMAHTFTPVEVVKAADCYAYQACEHAGWRMSPAYLLVSKIRLDALGPHSDGATMPGYMRAAWGIECSHSSPVSDKGDCRCAP
jgi:hypothetical protein